MCGSMTELLDGAFKEGASELMGYDDVRDQSPYQWFTSSWIPNTCRLKVSQSLTR